MRKLILISAFALASVFGAGRRNPQPAGCQRRAGGRGDRHAICTATADTAKPQASRKQASRSRKPQRETDEQKARRIAGKYGITW